MPWGGYPLQEETKMNKKITFTVEVSEELANKISNANSNYLEGPKYQSYLRELFQESRKNGVSNAQNNNEPLWSFFERFTDTSFAHFIRQESWCEFLRDIILDGIDEKDEDEILEIINSGCYEDLVSTIMNPYLYDGSYTYNTFKSRWIIADFADQMVIDFDELDSSINPIDNPERFLVYAMDFNMRNLLRNLDLSEVESVEEFKSVLEESNLNVEF
jgi:hypothetical protein